MQRFWTGAVVCALCAGMAAQAKIKEKRNPQDKNEFEKSVFEIRGADKAPAGLPGGGGPTASATTTAPS